MCEQIFDEDMDTWRVVTDCNGSDPNCASTVTHSAASDRPRGGGR